MSKINHNPDVLSCIANLSNDEVFTPPDVAGRMLDMLPQELWSNPDATFLDPACKSGVFLREIAKRLIAGLAGAIPEHFRLPTLTHPTATSSSTARSIPGTTAAAYSAAQAKMSTTETSASKHTPTDLYIPKNHKTYSK